MRRRWWTRAASSTPWRGCRVRAPGSISARRSVPQRASTGSFPGDGGRRQCRAREPCGAAPGDPTQAYSATVWRSRTATNPRYLLYPAPLYEHPRDGGPGSGRRCWRIRRSPSTSYEKYRRILDHAAPNASSSLWSAQVGAAAHQKRRWCTSCWCTSSAGAPVACGVRVAGAHELLRDAPCRSSSAGRRAFGRSAVTYRRPAEHRWRYQPPVVQQPPVAQPSGVEVVGGALAGGGPANRALSRSRSSRCGQQAAAQQLVVVVAEFAGTPAGAGTSRS